MDATKILWTVAWNVVFVVVVAAVDDREKYRGSKDTEVFVVAAVVVVAPVSGAVSGADVLSWTASWTCLKKNNKIHPSTRNSRRPQIHGYYRKPTML